MSMKDRKETKAFEKYLYSKGFRYERTSGSHQIYAKGAKTIVLPIRLNKMIKRRLIKEIEEV